MKTRKLVELLQKEDPSGEMEICIDTEEGFCDILHIESPYDGYAVYQKMERDWNNDYYNVVGARIRVDGNILFFRAISLQEALLDNPNLPVTVRGRNEEETARLKDKVSSWREESRKIKRDIMDPMFIRLLERLKEGHRILQKKTDPIGKFWTLHWDKIESNGYGFPKHGLVQGENQIVLKSGFFEPVELDNCIEWKFILRSMK
jgi:hypothetical protein